MIAPTTNSSNNKANSMNEDKGDDFKYHLQSLSPGILGLESSPKEWNKADDTFFSSYHNNPNNYTLTQKEMTLNSRLSMEEMAYLHMLSQNQHLNMELESNLGDHSDTKSFTPSPVLSIENLESDMMLLSTPNPDINSYHNDLYQYLQPQTINKCSKELSLNNSTSIDSNLNYLLHSTKSSNEIEALKQDNKLMNSILSPLEYEDLLTKTNDWKSVNLHNTPNLNDSSNHLLLDGMMANQYAASLLAHPSHPIPDHNMMLHNLSFPYFHPMNYYNPTLNYGMYPNFEDSYVSTNPHHNSFETVKVKRHKNVGRACTHCKKAHLACDESRPCKRCTHLGKQNCVDVEHKRRGRPKSSGNNNNANKKGSSGNKETSLSEGTTICKKEDEESSCHGSKCST
ncbi:hypothetical protein K502DRAFT_363068 [Neoconidiobolus thromboides FSU 785]|nr:hypothetical protein K502DRAFT_363068 [Neoconidiobolus thromboides FSU 785]